MNELEDKYGSAFDALQEMIEELQYMNSYKYTGTGGLEFRDNARFENDLRKIYEQSINEAVMFIAAAAGAIANLKARLPLTHPAEPKA